MIVDAGTANLDNNFFNNGMTTKIYGELSLGFAVIPVVYFVGPPKKFM